MKWFRLWHDMVDNPKVQNLPNKLFKAYINTLCIASANDPRGSLPPIQKYAFKMRMNIKETQKTLENLESFSLVFQENSKYFIHDWDEHQKNSDNIAVRVQRHREKSNVTGNVTETENVTEFSLNKEIQSTEEKRVEENREDNPPTPTPHKRGKREKAAEFDLSSIELPDWIPGEAWNQYVLHKAKIKTPLSVYGAKQTIKQLETAKNNGWSPEEMLIQSVVSGWKGCFFDKHKQPAPNAVSTITHPGGHNGNRKYTVADDNAREEAVMRNLARQRLEREQVTFSPQAEPQQRAVLNF